MLFSNNSKINKVLYKVLEPGIKTTDIKSDVDIYAFNVIVSKKSISFDVQINNKILHFKAPLIGGHNVENILPAIYIANYLGINDKEIRQSVENLVSLPQTMSFYKAQNGSSLIDDTFNVNPDGVLAAINYAKIYQGKKIIVLEPMIELGKNSYQEHYRVGKALADNCDYLFLTKNNLYEAIIHAVMDQRGKCLVKVATQKETVDFVLNHTGKDDVVIFEGREANLSLKKILENNLP